ncbi:bifunctional 3,4-dihydroxy-2-butanone-4-phosphate synthase/GTP cyclohydrolase II [Chlamydiales bacterium]|nr:bifunctional 3,4-dihydroxy-2-butanone-4-phosphate synthase/GTP cyclohydrolase II [Chlamydiales bacterium]
MSKNLCSVEEAIQRVQKGEFIIVTDDEKRENEGDLVLAAEHATDESIAFMVRHTSGIICVALSESRLKELNIPQMCVNNTDPKKTAFTVSVDAAEKTTTGISASDRKNTILSLIHPDTKPCDLNRPGHIFPLKSVEGGVLKRAGHTEAAYDLTVLANCIPGGVIAEIVNDNGTVAKKEDLKLFSEKYQIPQISISDLIKFRRKDEHLVKCVAEAWLPTPYGNFLSKVYRSSLDKIEHFALVKGDIDPEKPLLVRVHSECLTGDIFHSKKCDCGKQLDLAMHKIEEAKSGVIIYLRGHEGRGIGLTHKLNAYKLQEEGLDTIEANLKLGLPVDSREYGIGAEILADLGVKKISLLTNNPEKYSGIKGFGLEIEGRVPLIVEETPENARYLKTKREKLGHLI